MICASSSNCPLQYHFTPLHTSFSTSPPGHFSFWLFVFFLLVFDKQTSPKERQQHDVFDVGNVCSASMGRVCTLTNQQIVSHFSFFFFRFLSFSSIYSFSIVLSPSTPSCCIHNPQSTIHYPQTQTQTQTPASYTPSSHHSLPIFSLPG